MWLKLGRATELCSDFIAQRHEHEIGQYLQSSVVVYRTDGHQWILQICSRSHRCGHAVVSDIVKFIGV
jgi:hypothetical protein